MIEGHTGLRVKELRSITQYDGGYSDDHPFIKGFWEIVSSYDDEERRHLLEFVTANSRVPVNGIRSLMFGIVRNGGDTERIPTAMTCFGKLLLPEYCCVGKLRTKLRIALDNRRGFGSV